MALRTLPKNVYEEVNRHGKKVLYFRRGKGPRWRMPNDVRSEEFQAAYRSAAQNVRPQILPPEQGPTLRQKIEMQLRAALVTAQVRARRKGIDFGIDIDWALDEVVKTDLCCPLTGIKFFTQPAARSRQHPYAPSIDKIDPRGGYTKDNCRIVIYAINVMLHDWGPKVFEKVADRYRAHQRA